MKIVWDSIILDVVICNWCSQCQCFQHQNFLRFYKTKTQNVFINKFAIMSHKYNCQSVKISFTKYYKASHKLILFSLSFYLCKAKSSCFKEITCLWFYGNNSKNFIKQTPSRTYCEVISYKYKEKLTEDFHGNKQLIFNDSSSFPIDWALDTAY